jgi:predicted Fe-Mo cluster-binding NifX family protein
MVEAILHRDSPRLAPARSWRFESAFTFRRRYSRRQPAWALGCRVRHGECNGAHRLLAVRLAVRRRYPPLGRSNVKIAIPVLNGRISPVLDTAGRLVVVTHDRRRETARRDFVPGFLAANALARALAEQEVDQLLCAAVSSNLLRALQREGIRVRSHLCGPIDAILDAFAHGRLHGAQFRMPGCWGENYHHEQAPRRQCR